VPSGKVTNPGFRSVAVQCTDFDTFDELDWNEKQPVVWRQSAVMRERIATETLDLVHLDHPFKSDLNYNVPAGSTRQPANVKLLGATKFGLLLSLTTPQVSGES
jgi:hypothetical protein